jgi:hypothetical protein
MLHVNIRVLCQCYVCLGNVVKVSSLFSKASKELTVALYRYVLPLLQYPSLLSCTLFSINFSPRQAKS